MGELSGPQIPLKLTPIFRFTHWRVKRAQGAYLDDSLQVCKQSLDCLKTIPQTENHL